MIRQKLHLMLVAVGGLWLGLASPLAQAQAEIAKAATSGARPSLTVTVAAPKMQNLAHNLTANGSLHAWQESSVGAETHNLRITEVRVNVGDTVQRGDVLAVMQTDTLRAELAQSESVLTESVAHAREAKAQAERARSLRLQGFFSAAKLDQAVAAEASAQARAESARALVRLQGVRLAQAQVRAPDAGVISARLASVGSVVGAGTELFRLIRQGRLEWRAEVTAADIERVKKGAAVQVRAASGQLLLGKVRMLSPALDPKTRNALVYVDLPVPTGSARAGMFAQGVISLGQNQTMTVPLTALLVRDGFSYVMTVGNDQKVGQIKVQTGRLDGEWVEVISGLSADARVVVSGAAFLNHGDTVRVQSVPTSEHTPPAQ